MQIFRETPGFTETCEPMANDGAESDVEEALAACGREPIPTPGFIQPHGVLLAADRASEQFIYASANTRQALGIDLSEVLTKTFRPFFGSELSHAIRSAYAAPTIRSEKASIGLWSSPKGPLSAFLHVNAQEHLLFELLRPGDEDGWARRLADLARLLGQVRSAHSIQHVLDAAVRNVAYLSGYDRVMAYRFLIDDVGEVVAEFRPPERESYLGLRYPADDIPSLGRALLARTPLRLIADTRDQPIEIVSCLPSGPPLDMSLSILRGVAGVHRTYLENMGVRASMSLPLMCEGKLWGLIACHHYEPRPLPAPALIACEVAGLTISMTLEQAVNRRVYEASAQIEAASHEVLALEQGVPPIEVSSAVDLTEIKAALDALIPSDGLALCFEDRVEQTGLDVESELIRSVAARASGPGIFAESNLGPAPDEHGWGAVAGALAVPLIDKGPEFDDRSKLASVVFLRLPSEQVIRSAGAPDKILSRAEAGLRLEPWASFEAYLETVRGQSAPWTADELRWAGLLQSRLTALQTVQGSHDRRALRLMVHELNHRARNILALVRSLVTQAERSTTTVDDFVRSVESRMASLAMSQGFLTHREAGGVSLRILVKTELAPFEDEGGSRASIGGPPVRLKPSVVPLTALVFHELMTNAAKYGALSSPSGRVSVGWSRAREGLQMSWVETGGPRVVPPQRTGVGRRILERAFPYELDGEAVLEFLPEGLRAQFWLPDRTFEAEAEPDVSNPEPIETGPAPARPFGRALVVEDSYVLASEVEAMLGELGFATVDLAPSLRRGRQALSALAYDLVVLDLDLRGELSFPLADFLFEQSVPFIFTTGYDASAPLPEKYRGVPLLSKPVDKETFIRRVEGMLSRRRRG